MENFIQLNLSDNVAISLKNLDKGSIITICGQDVKLLVDIGFGHKIAIKPIKKKEKILKYGLPIGSATQDIEAGEHVHVHNLESDYILNHT